MTSRIRSMGASRLFISLLIVGAVGSLAAAPSASAAPACTSSFSRDINSYVLFAYSDLIFKGGDINGGNIGVNYDTGGAASELTLTNVKTNMPQAGQQVVADKVASQISSTVLQDVYANSLGTFNGTVQGCGPTSLAGFGGLPIIATANLPSLPTISPGTTDVTVDGTNSPLTLPPGQYRDLRVNDGRVLNLGNGVYHFAKLTTGPNATINTTDGTEVRVAGEFSLQNQVTITGSDLAKFIIGSTGTTHLTHFGEVHGQFFAPNGEINLEGGATLFGRFVANEIAGDGPHDITYRAPGSIDGTKYLDSDADGQIEAGDPGLGGFIFYVDYNDNNQLDAGEPSGVSDSSGHYSIENVTPGTWNVREVQDPAYTCSFPGSCTNSVTVDQGETDTGNDFANWTTAGKSGTKFEDLDADGNDREPGEPGLAGWTIYVDYNDNGVMDANEPFGVTNASGNYSIAGIQPGTWKVREVGQPNWACSFPQTSDGFGCYHQENFQSSGSYPDNNFGNWTTASKSGVKFEDIDRDRVDREPGEPGLEGFTIYIDYNNNGVKDPDEPFGISAVDGSYQITGIAPGTWKVREVGQTGWTCTFPTTRDQFGCYRQETFQSSGSYANNNFGNHRGPELRHFQCYEIHRQPIFRTGVKLVDAFGTSTVTIEQAKRLCAPANKNNEDPQAPAQPEHMTTYTLKQTSPKFKKVKGVVAHNQFGDTTMTLTKPDRLLVPTSKSLTGSPGPLANPPDHYKCYLTSGAKFKRKGISIQDQFGSITVEIKKVLNFCPPVDKNDEGVINNSESLTCYQVAGPPQANRPPAIYTRNQFGPDGPFQIFGPRELCVPGTASIPQ